MPLYADHIRFKPKVYGTAECMRHPEVLLALLSRLQRLLPTSELPIPDSCLQGMFCSPDYPVPIDLSKSLDGIDGVVLREFSKLWRSFGVSEEQKSNKEICARLLHDMMCGLAFKGRCDRNASRVSQKYPPNAAPAKGVCRFAGGCPVGFVRLNKTCSTVLRPFCDAAPYL